MFSPHLQNCLFSAGVEGGETACKLARKWGYAKKKIPKIRPKLYLLKETSGAEQCLPFPVLLILAVMKVLGHSCQVL